jgi:hypothetical protein
MMFYVVEKLAGHELAMIYKTILRLPSQPDEDVTR